MNLYKLINGCMPKYYNADTLEGTWNTVPGCIVFDDWRPLSYIAMVLDYKDVIYNNLIKAECRFLAKSKVFFLEEDPDYKFISIKIPKFDYVNACKVGCVIQDSLGEVIAEGGTEYVSLFNKVSDAIV